MSDRKLVTVREVFSVEPIPNADKIELVRIDGWQVVSGKDNFKPGDFCVFHEIDSFLPLTHSAYEWLKPKAIKWNGKEGARIKSIRLKGVLSQGLALPVSDFPEIDNILKGAEELRGKIDWSETDFSEILGVEKWEKSDFSGTQNMQRKGSFPSDIPKTDEERIQNVFNKINRKEMYQVTQKMDGASMTVFVSKNGEFGICSRNNELIEHEDNSFWKAANKYNIRDTLKSISRGTGIAIQGELVGPGINGNKHKLNEIDFMVFNMFDIHDGMYYSPEITKELCEEWGLKHVPIITHRYFDFENIEEALRYAETIQNGEGVVFKKIKGFQPYFFNKKTMSPHSFKIISNTYLLANDG